MPPNGALPWRTKQLRHVRTSLSHRPQTTTRFRKDGGEVLGRDPGPIGAYGARGLPPLAPPPHHLSTQEDRHGHQRHQPSCLGPVHDAGSRKNGGIGSTDSEKQHNGIDLAGFHGHHAWFRHRRAHGQRLGHVWAVRKGEKQRIHLRQLERRDPLVEVLLHPDILPPGIPLQCSVHSLLQPWRCPHQRPSQVARSPTHHHRLRRQGTQPSELLLVLGPQSILPVFPVVPVAIRSHTHVRLLPCHVFPALFLGCFL